jgi:pyruvate/2-oxoglutarate dehydrogenase complex dihydrolipoamide dehydrogenase (E3) component
MSHVRAVVEADAATHPPKSFEGEGINVFFSSPQFINNHQIRLGERTVSSKKFIICTGSHPLVPDIEGLGEISYLTNETIFDLEVLPESIIIIGAGPIGIELASALNHLDVRITVILRSGEIFKKEDRQFADKLMETLRDEGVTILTHTNPHFPDEVVQKK